MTGQITEYNSDGTDQNSKTVKCFKEVLMEYCQESSIGGLKRVVERKRKRTERCIWGIILVASLGCSILLGRAMVLSYTKAPLVTSQLPQGVPVSEIVFPAVSVCSVNRISRKAVNNYIKKIKNRKSNLKMNETEIRYHMLSLGRFYDLQITDVRRLEELHELLGDYETNDLLKYYFYVHKLTPECDALLLRCKWEGESINCSSLLEYRLTMNGYCCVFNYMRPSDDFLSVEGRSMEMYEYGNKSQFGYNKGLQILFDTMEDDYFYGSLPTAGILLTFTDAYDFPDSSSGSYSIQLVGPDLRVWVLISASMTEASDDIRHIKPSQRGCLFHDESDFIQFYTYSDCLLKCRALFLYEKCNCTPFNVPKTIAAAKTCNLLDLLCLKNYSAAQASTPRPNTRDLSSDLELDMVNGGLACPQCLPACSSTRYLLDTNHVALHSSELDMVPNDKREPWLRGVNFSQKSIFHIRYAEEFANAYTEKVVMQWFDLLSNIGSTCGIITGFSFVSLMEFIYFITFKFYKRTRFQSEQPNTPTTGTSSVENPGSEIIAEPPDNNIYWAEIVTPGSRQSRH